MCPNVYKFDIPVKTNGSVKPATFYVRSQAPPSAQDVIEMLKSKKEKLLLGEPKSDLERKAQDFRCRDLDEAIYALEHCDRTQWSCPTEPGKKSVVWCLTRTDKSPMIIKLLEVSEIPEDEKKENVKQESLVSN
jgi:hypothetical protein